MLLSPSNAERFDSRIMMIEGGCWLWLGYLDRKGYGRFSLGHKNRIAHRIAYEHYIGPIPDGLPLDHLCRNRACVNPAHLEPVTTKVNNSRMVPNNGKAARTHCPQGHLLAGDNLKVNKRGHRVCRECAKSANVRLRARQKALA